MKQRAAVILIHNAQVALIQRLRDHSRYFLFPGGTVEPGETVEQAAIREAYEELGVHVTLDRLVAVAERPDSSQYYFLARIECGEFGSGFGEELSSPADSERGSYHPCWVSVQDLPHDDVRPRTLALAVASGRVTGLDAPLTLTD